MSCAVQLVISARKGEFETGYGRGGQTHEHVQLAKTLGVSKLLVVVNKMDGPTVNWSKERYDEIESKMIPFLRSSGYNVKKDVLFLPISGLMGSNIETRVEKNICPWRDGQCLFEALDAVEVPPHDPKGPFSSQTTSAITSGLMSCLHQYSSRIGMVRHLQGELRAVS